MVRGPTWNPTEGLSGCARMRPPRYFQHTPHTLRGPTGSPTECTQWLRPHAPAALILAHPSH
eukprot:2952267-Pyramimonas_sp.AAC.1